MKKIALCVFGVNGVGKTTLLQALMETSTELVTVFRGSTILKQTLGTTSYEGLESMSADKKKQTLISGMEATIANAESAIVMVDTHLIVPIRNAERLTIEDMWDDAMMNFFHGFIFITADPAVIAERRRSDGERTLRVMHATPQVCAEDLRINATRWNEISLHMSHKQILINNQTVLIGAKKISDFIQTVRASL